MLTDKQRELIIEGFSKGVPDAMIAEIITGLSQTQVYNFRHLMGISAKTVLNNKYDTWIRMLNDGVSLDVISDIYKVQPRSIQIALWREKKFSFVQVKKIVKKAEAERMLGALKKSSKGSFNW